MQVWGPSAALELCLPQALPAQFSVRIRREQDRARDGRPSAETSETRVKTLTLTLEQIVCFFLSFKFVFSTVDSNTYFPGSRGHHVDKAQRST